MNDLKQLYDVDDAQWLEETVNLLKKHQFQQLDLDNLIEELEDLGKLKQWMLWLFPLNVLILWNNC